MGADFRQRSGRVAAAGAGCGAGRMVSCGIRGVSGRVVWLISADVIRGRGPAWGRVSPCV